MGSACFPLMGGDSTLNQITKVRLPDGQEVAIVDWSYRPLYSQLDTLSAWTDQELAMFNYGNGDIVSASQNLITAGGQRNATLSQTNITTPSQMDALEEYLVYAMSVEIYYSSFSQGEYSNALAGQPLPNLTMVAAIHTLILELEVSEKAFYQASVGWFAAGFGPFGVVDSIAAVGAGRSYASNGLPSAEAIDASPVPVHIGGTENYQVLLHNPGGATITYRDDDGVAIPAAVISLRTNFRGLHKRPAG